MIRNGFDTFHYTLEIFEKLVSDTKYVSHTRGSGLLMTPEPYGSRTLDPSSSPRSSTFPPHFLLVTERLQLLLDFIINLGGLLRFRSLSYVHLFLLIVCLAFHLAPLFQSVLESV